MLQTAFQTKFDLPAGTTYDWKTPVDTTTSGVSRNSSGDLPRWNQDEVPVTVRN